MKYYNNNSAGNFLSSPTETHIQIEIERERETHTRIETLTLESLHMKIECKYACNACMYMCVCVCVASSVVLLLLCACFFLIVFNTCCFSINASRAHSKVAAAGNSSFALHFSRGGNATPPRMPMQLCAIYSCCCWERATKRVRERHWEWKWQRMISLCESQSQKHSKRETESELKRAKLKERNWESASWERVLPEIFHCELM